MSSKHTIRFYARLAAAAAIALLAAFAPLNDAAAGNPDLRFRSIKTEHFRIHFHQGLDDVALELAEIAEEIHEELSIRFGWEVDGPTEVVLTDSTDDANGSATASPRPLIRLFASRPSADSSLATHDDWLRTLFVHEYTHVVQLQMHGGFARFVNAIFGDVYLPNQMQPTWFIEGMAVLSETYRTTAGRIRSAQFTAAIRMNALEGKLLSLGEMSNDTRQYPRGNTPYIYGAMFVDYLRSRFGEEKLYEICREYGSNTLPYAMNRTFAHVLGVPLDRLYDDWLVTVRNQAIAKKEELEARGLTRSTRLTRDGESKGQPSFSRDGREIFVAIANGDMDSGVYAVPVDGSGKPRALVLSGGNSHLSTTRRNDLYYTRTGPYGKDRRTSDVFVLEDGAHAPRRVTHGARSREAEVSPSGRRLALVTIANARTRLVLADERGAVLKDLIVPGPGDQVYHPTWSPDGRTIAAVVRREGRTHLEIVDVVTGDRSVVYEGPGIESDPAFDPSGRYLLFTSDRTGVSNIFAIDLENAVLKQLTNVLGGASGPAVSPDGTALAFIDFSSAGYDLHIARFAPDKAQTAVRIVDGEKVVKWRPPSRKIAIAPYNPLPSLVPRSWMLGAQFSGEQTVLQATTGTSDAVGRHAVAAAVSYGLDARTFGVSGAYSYSGMVPSMNLSVSHRTVSREDGYLVGGIPRAWDQIMTSASLGLGVSIPGIDRENGLSLSYELTYAAPRKDVEIALDPNGDLPEIPVQYFRAGLNFGWSYSDVRGSPFGISPESGRKLRASVGIDHPAFGSDMKVFSFSYGWTEYLEAPWLDHHVFALRVSGTMYVTDPAEQAALYVGGYSDQNLIDSLWNNAPAGLPALRGYPPGAFAGDQAHVGRLEYRFPIWWFEAAYKTVPLFFRNLYAAVFTDHALISFDPLDRDDWRASVGAELVWSLRFGYYMPITIRTGYARGLMDGGVNEVIAVFGGSF